MFSNNLVKPFFTKIISLVNIKIEYQIRNILISMNKMFVAMLSIKICSFLNINICTLLNVITKIVFLAL